MADNYLENHQEEYERRKEAWLKKRKVVSKNKLKPKIERPEDESL